MKNKVKVLKVQTDLFATSNESTVETRLDAKRLVVLRKLVIENEEHLTEKYFKACYSKHKNLIKSSLNQLVHLSDVELSEVMCASAYFLHLQRDIILGRNKPKNYQDLNVFLGTNPLKNFDIKSKYLTQNITGLSYLNFFIKEYIINTRVDGVRKTLSLLELFDNWKQLYRTALKLLQFEVSVTDGNLFNKIGFMNGIQIPSNFRPVSASIIWQKYGLNTRKNPSELWVHCSSEGFLGRLLGVFHLAYHNPDIKVHYWTIDPNIKIADMFQTVVNDLIMYTGVTNFFPVIHNHGSEVDEADFYKHFKVKFDVSFTSPPYFNLEKYGETHKLVTVIDIEDKASLHNFSVNNKTEKLKYIQAIKRYKEDNTLSIKCKVDNKYIPFIESHLISEWDEIGDKTVGSLKLGDSFKRNETDSYNIKVILNEVIGQSHQYKTSNSWDENFLRPTIQNIKKLLNPKGHLILNVVNIKSHPLLEDSVVDIGVEEGLKHIDTLKLKLSRVPGGVMQKDGTNLKLKDVKSDFEPMFVFKNC